MIDAVERTSGSAPRLRWPTPSARDQEGGTLSVPTPSTASRTRGEHAACLVSRRSEGAAWALERKLRRRKRCDAWEGALIGCEEQPVAWAALTAILNAEGQ